MKILDKKTVLTTRPFSVEEVTVSVGDETFKKPYHRIVAPDWVNVLPIVGAGADAKALLIRQPRAGAGKFILEVPGGMLDPGEEKDPMMAAMRELEEETGFTSQRVLPLAVINPNPAIMTNRAHFFLALACVPNSSRTHFPDSEERIETHFVPLVELEGMVRTGQIDHALAALCIMLAGKYVKIAP